MLLQRLQFLPSMSPMKPSKPMLLLLLLVAIVATRAAPGKKKASTFLSDPSWPRYFKCESDAHCSVDQCCVLGMQRYGQPQCQALGGLDDACRPGDGVRFDRVHTYDGREVLVDGLHASVCPCGLGLACHPRLGLCRPVEDEKAPPFPVLMMPTSNELLSSERRHKIVMSPPSNSDWHAGNIWGRQ